MWPPVEFSIWTQNRQKQSDDFRGDCVVICRIQSRQPRQFTECLKPKAQSHGKSLVVFVILCPNLKVLGRPAGDSFFSFLVFKFCFQKLKISILDSIFEFLSPQNQKQFYFFLRRLCGYLPYPEKAASSVSFGREVSTLSLRV